MAKASKKVDLTQAQIDKMLDEARSEGVSEGRNKDVYLQVAAKGGVSLYGIRRFPVTFYLEEWERIFEMKDAIETFMKTNRKSLKTKKEAQAA